MTAPTIIYTEEPSGKCPVQAEGTINGREFYFRSRGSRWALHVAGPCGNVFASDQWSHSEEYPGCADEEPTLIGEREVKFGAGHAEPEECKEFITRVAALWVEQQSKP